MADARNNDGRASGTQASIPLRPSGRVELPSNEHQSSQTADSRVGNPASMAEVEIHELPEDAEIVDEPPARDPESSPPSIPSAAEVASTSLALAAPGMKPVATPVLPGDLIADRYEVIDVLGEGGMGIVHKCRDLFDEGLVAVKRVIVPDSSHAEEYVMWFYKEARALAALSHPSIVRARDFGQLRDGSPYLAMDLATGVSLHDLMHAGLTFPVIWSVIDQVLNGLAHAHHPWFTSSISAWHGSSKILTTNDSMARRPWSLHLTRVPARLGIWHRSRSSTRCITSAARPTCIRWVASCTNS